MYVHYNDGTIESAFVVRKCFSPSGHAVLMTTSRTGQSRPTVSFRTTKPTREEVFVVAEVEGGYKGFNMLTGTVISPSCKARNQKSGRVALGSEHKFALSCVAHNILGAAVFDLDCLLVGTISELGDGYDPCFSTQSCHWVKQLEDYLGAANTSISLSKDRKFNILKVETKKRKHVALEGGPSQS